MPSKTPARLVHTEDLDLILSLNRSCFAAPTPISAEELEESEWWVVRLLGETVGFGGVQPFPEDHKGYLTRAGVLKAARGGGLQQRLIHRRVAWARSAGLERVYTHVWAGNIGSMRSLAKAGFLPYYTERAECVGPNPEELTFVYFEKLLVPGALGWNKRAA